MDFSNKYMAQVNSLGEVANLANFLSLFTFHIVIRIVLDFFILVKYIFCLLVDLRILIRNKHTKINALFFKNII